ncbi:MAG TPA: ATP-grasp domain-containing protein [Steroidobacter sp.]
MNRFPALRIEHVHTYAGPSVFAQEPVVVARLTLSPEVMGDAGARIERMSAVCRAWFDSAHEPGQHPTPLEVGKFVAQWAHAALTEIRGHLHVADAVAEQDGVLLVLDYHHPDLCLLALELAAAIFAEIHRCTVQDVAARLSKFLQTCRRHHPDYQAAILMTAARAAGIPVLPFLQNARCWQYGWGARSRVFMESASTGESLIGGRLVENKAACKAFLRAQGLPTPSHVSIDSADELSKALAHVGFPCVVKPLQGSKGRGVTAGIDSLERAKTAFHVARHASPGPVMVEQFLAGDDHRLMVINGTFAATIRREPPVVVGDGRRSVRQLLAELNRPRSINLVRSRYLRPIPLDDFVLECLRAQQATPDFVPACSQRIKLRTNANLSSGGVCIDVTESTHPMLKAMVEQAAASLGLPISDFDYITTDISRSPWESGGAFIEANCMPGLDATIAAGWSAEQIGRITLGEGVGRIPVSLFISDSPQAPSELPTGQRPSLARALRDEVWIDETVYCVNATEP